MKYGPTFYICSAVSSLGHHIYTPMLILGFLILGGIAGLSEPGKSIIKRREQADD